MNYNAYTMKDGEEVPYKKECPKCFDKNCCFVKRHNMHVGLHCKHCGFIKFLPQNVKYIKRAINRKIQKEVTVDEIKRRIYSTNLSSDCPF